MIRLIYKRSPDGGWATTMEDVTERRRVAAKIEHLAHYDALTNLPNRTLFQRHAEGLLLQTADVQFAILYIDIDEFKRINDSLGHLIGDEFLRGVSGRLLESVGPSDFVARLGGDEFAILQRDVVSDDGCRGADRAGSIRRCERRSIASATASAATPASASPSRRVTVPICSGCSRAPIWRCMRRRRPAAGPIASSSRRWKRRPICAANSSGICGPRSPKAALRSITSRLSICAATTITGCEALLRWRHPVRGMVSPAEFIPVAEETGLIEEIGQWVLRTACAEAATWPGHIRVAVNVSPVQFRSPTLSLKVAAALAETGLDPRRLELEITEAVLIADDDAALVALNQLRALGVHIALDDFGTGYSSLSYLQRFPFDKIKIDRSFVKELMRGTGSASIIKAVVSIAADRNMITTAEGVETEQQRDTVQSLGCTQMQGYLFSAARPAHEIRAMLAVPPGGCRRSGVRGGGQT